jgi:alkanesulfonate monooxygenase SsuD/methylene tetrahydromethanopterin reductase-like flavin-dependent oxidoreductase (luciferase family)
VQPDLPMWIGGSSEAAIRRTARFGTGWQAGAETPVLAGTVVAAIRTATLAAGRSIDEDHFGAGFPFRFGRADDPGVSRAMEAYAKRTGRDPAGYFAIGDAANITTRLAQYVAAGISKFILRPLARGDDDLLTQTRRLVDEVLPQVKARWPKPAKSM